MNRKFTLLKSLSPLLLVCLSAIPAAGQTGKGTINGSVVTAANKPAGYISIVLEGTGITGMTDEQGRFSLHAVAGTYNLICTAVGFARQQRKVSVKSNKTTSIRLTIQEDQQQLSEVVVTGNRSDYVVETPSESLRLNTPLIEVPQNISVVTRQTMRDFGITGTAEMSRLTSGIVRRYGNANDFAFTIRGTDATNNVFRNGVGSYWWNQQSDAFMIERVEFVKGPAGFMIGNSEPGGLLNEVTKQADGKQVQDAEIGYGSWNLFRAGLDLGGRFSPQGKFSYRLVAGGQRTNASYDFYRSSRIYVMPSVRYSYGDQSFIQLELNRMDGFVKAENYANVSRTGTNDWLFPVRFNATDPNAVNGIETDDNYIRLSHTHRLRNGWQIKSQLADVRGLYKGDNMYVSRPSLNFDTLYRNYYYSDWRNRLQAAQTFIDGKFKTGGRVEHAILAGMDYGKSWVRSAWGEGVDQDTVAGNELPIAVRNPVYNLQKGASIPLEMYPADDWGTEWASLYVQDHVKFFGKVVITLAGRFSHTRSWASYDSVTVYNNKLTPRLGLTYLFTQHLSAYTLFDETFLPQTGRKQDRTSARPLTGSNIEAGIKSQLLNQRLAINASVFRTVKNNVLVQNPLTEFYAERGQIISQGFEVDMSGSLAAGLIVNANYTVTDAKITKDANPEIVGFLNYGVARHNGNAMLRYKFMRGKLEGISAGMGAQLMGRRSAVWAGWSDPRDKNVTSPAYTLLDANLGYETHIFSIRANVFNLLNRQGMDSASWNSGADENTPGYFTFSPLQPLNFRLMASYKF